MPRLQKRERHKKTKVPKELRSIAKSRKGGRCKAEGCRAPVWNAKPDNAADAAFSIEFCGFVFLWNRAEARGTKKNFFSYLAAGGGPCSQWMKASWMAATARSASVLSMMTLILISLVEIIWMLMPWLNSASNMVEATPEWLCMPAPTMDTLA